MRGAETERAVPGFGRAPLLLDQDVSAVRLDVIDGPDAGKRAWLVAPSASLGSAPTNDVVLGDATVSRFHCELLLDDRGLRIRDLSSTNGTFVDGVPVVEAYLRTESVFRIGETTIALTPGEARPRRISARSRFGDMVGRSLPMRVLFAQLERAARGDSTVLLAGETGTGKEEAARALHETSDRTDGPFVVVDCGALSRTLVESELFGHERGAFTDAHQERAGAFELAHGGTLFLDEIGELPLELQSRLLRALEARSVRRVGSGEEREVDVRIVAATHRDLRAEVNTGRFREDLYYRLAVIEVRLPPLRERLEDLPVLASALLRRTGGDDAVELLTEDLLAQLARSSWPGNVRQLRNFLERAAHLEAPVLPGAVEAPTDPIDPELTYDEARRVALADFERRYLAALLGACDDQVAEAARRARMNRSYLHKLLRRHGLRG